MSKKKKDLVTEVTKAIAEAAPGPEAPKEEKDPKADWIVAPGGKRRPHP